MDAWPYFLKVGQMYISILPLDYLVAYLIVNRYGIRLFLSYADVFVDTVSKGFLPPLWHLLAICLIGFFLTRPHRCIYTKRRDLVGFRLVIK